MHWYKLLQKIQPIIDFGYKVLIVYIIFCVCCKGCKVGSHYLINIGLSVVEGIEGCVYFGSCRYYSFQSVV